MKESKMILPTDSTERKGLPIGTGVIDYFPLALAEVSKCSKAGNEQHHPGQPLHWDKTKSTDRADCLIRHFIDRGKIDLVGVRESARMAWRALEILQIELESEQQEQTKPEVDSDGWIPWSGGNCPVDGETLVMWKTKEETVLEARRAKYLYWSHSPFTNHILAYKVAE